MVLLSGKKYTIDYYQREFKWGEKQITELIEDLTSAFFDYYAEEHIRKDVASYGHYFLGSVIISLKDGQNYIIDGQQRLTSLTLLLMFLHNLQKEQGQMEVKIAELIYSEKYGEKSFNLNIQERAACMAQLFDRGSYENGEDTESIQNISKGYDCINDAFPDKLKEQALPFFIDWLVDNVVLVEITAYSDQDAYRVFETMNDRGLSLTPTEMLKGHLLSNIRDEQKKNQCNALWKERIKTLLDIDKDEDADCIKSWLRSQYAESIRERKKDAAPQDYDKIGTEFHRWVFDQQERLSLDRSDDYIRFIQREFEFYARVYITCKQASHTFTTNYEHLFYIAQVGFTLHYPLLLAPLSVSDSLQEVSKKLRLTAIFLDIMLYRRLWNLRSIDYNTMSYAIFQLIKKVRNKPITELTEILTRQLKSDNETFRNSRYSFRLHMMNQKHVKNILARLTAYVEEQSGLSSHYLEYINRKSRYEIEHIWADKPERHQDEFTTAEEFDQHRNLIGGLLLLPKSFNASYGALRYEEKLPHYYGQNLLAQSLNEQAYSHNPGFLRFIQNSGLSFHPYTCFKKSHMLERQSLYQELAEKIWNPDHIKTELET